MELWLNLKTAEPKLHKQYKKTKIEELAACDISGIDLIEEQYDRKHSIDHNNGGIHSKNYESSLINETCNEILESMAEQSSSVRPIEFGDSHVDEENESSDEEVNVYDYDDQDVDMGKVHEELKNDIEDLGKNMADLLKQLDINDSGGLFSPNTKKAIMNAGGNSSDDDEDLHFFPKRKSVLKHTMDNDSIHDL